MSEARTEELVIPLPRIAPTGIAVTAEACRAVWDDFIKPGQDHGELQSIEERTLMAILRAVYAGLSRRSFATDHDDHDHDDHDHDALSGAAYHTCATGLLRREAQASAALDGETIALDQPEPTTQGGKG